MLRGPGGQKSGVQFANARQERALRASCAAPCNRPWPPVQVWPVAPEGQKLKDVTLACMAPGPKSSVAYEVQLTRIWLEHA